MLSEHLIQARSKGVGGGVTVIDIQVHPCTRTWQQSGSAYCLLIVPAAEEEQILNDFLFSKRNYTFIFLQ